MNIVEPGGRSVEIIIGEIGMRNMRHRLHRLAVFLCDQRGVTPGQHHELVRTFQDILAYLTGEEITVSEVLRKIVNGGNERNVGKTPHQFPRIERYHGQI